MTGFLIVAGSVLLGIAAAAAARAVYEILTDPHGLHAYTDQAQLDRLAVIIDGDREDREVAQLDDLFGHPSPEARLDLFELTQNEQSDRV